MNKGLSDSEKQQMLPMLKGSKDALEIVDILMGISHIWDDLIDKDEKVTDDDINAVFFSTLITLQKNPLFCKYRMELLATMETAIYDWMVSCSMETSERQNLPASWVLRTSLSNIIIQLASLLGGYEHAIEVAHEFKHNMLDDWKAYESEHRRIM